MNTLTTIILVYLGLNIAITIVNVLLNWRAWQNMENANREILISVSLSLIFGVFYVLIAFGIIGAVAIKDYLNEKKYLYLKRRK